MRPGPKLVDAESLSDFDYRIIITSTPGFHDAKLLNIHLQKYLKDLGLTPATKGAAVLLVADTNVPVLTMTERWCAEHDFVLCKFVAPWGAVDHEDAVVRTNRQGVEYNALAGYWVHEEMAEVANYLITFYDGVSPQNQDLVQRMGEHHNPCRAILVHIDKDEEGNNYGRQSQGG